MMTEKGKLPVGIKFDGKLHRDYEMRQQLVRDSIEAVEDERAKINDSYLGLIMVAKQIKKLGDIPPEEITAELFMDMVAADLTVLTGASERLKEREHSFCKKDKKPEEVDTGASEAGVSS